jgi:hypothetical protein
MSDTAPSVGSKRKPRVSDRAVPSLNHVKRHSVSHLNETTVTELAPECAAGIRVTFREVTAAAYRTKSGIQKTPLVVSMACCYYMLNCIFSMLLVCC